jgi:hypothetical protein
MLKKLFYLLSIMILILACFNLCSLDSAQAEQLQPIAPVYDQSQEPPSSRLMEKAPALEGKNDLPVLSPELSKRLFERDRQLLQPQSFGLPSSPEDYLRTGPWDPYTWSSNWTIPSQDAEIVELVTQITGGLDSDSEKAAAIYQWVAKNITYDYSFTYYYAMETLHNRTGVCNGYALLLATMMRAGGIPCKFVSGAANGGRGWPDPSKTNHAWNEIYLDGQWYSVDATWDSCLGSDDYYLMDEKTFSEDHHKILVDFDLNTFYNGQNLNLAFSTSGLDQGYQIYYTIDGTTPTVNSTLYNSPIAIHDGVLLKAIMVVPQGVVSWLVMPFDSLAKIYRCELKDDKVEIMYYVGNGGNVVIPSTICGCPVTSIQEWAFYDCAGLTSITIPQSVSSIGYGAFGYCNSLTRITIHSATTEIDKDGFTIPCQATIIGYDPSTAKDFAAKHGRMFAVIGSAEPPVDLAWSYTVVDDEAQITKFIGDRSYVALPVTLGGYPVTSIGDRAFMSNYFLTDIHLPEGITRIGVQAFCYCSNLTSIVIPAGVTKIDAAAFYFCWDLTSIIFKSATTTIDDSSYTIPAATRIIGYETSTAKDYALKYERTFVDIQGYKSNVSTIAVKSGADNIIKAINNNPAGTERDPRWITVAKGTTVAEMINAIEASDQSGQSFWVFEHLGALYDKEPMDNAEFLSSGNILGVVAEDGVSKAGYVITAEEQSTDQCFIATAAFGSKFTWPVALLRHFRDQYLLTNSLGTAFVEFYYQNSPPIAAFIATSEPLKMLVRVLLAPIIAIVYLIYHPILMGIILLLLILFSAYRNRTKITQTSGV